MRKLISLVVVLFFLSLVVVPVQAQDSAIIPIDLSATIVAGCYLEISPTAVTWTLDALAEANGWIPGDVSLDYVVAYRLPILNRLQLVQESLTDFTYGDGTTTLPIETYGKQVFTGDISYTGFLAPVVAGMQEVYMSSDAAGSKTGRIKLLFWNDASMRPGAVTATIQYTAIDFNTT